MYLVFFISLGFLFGVIGVASNPSPCFGAGALVVASGFGCGMLAEFGHSFVALVLFLVYLGGMLVVFAYSIALASDVYPQAWGNYVVGLSGFWYFLVAMLIVWAGGGNLGFFGVGGGLVYALDSGYGGISMLYSVGGACLFFLGFGLLLTLFVVLELARVEGFVARK
uniref:NADH-ubiquinone oxidoreductase chain 6 n=1 Tax=Chlamydosaurus kingii TaxID=103699 RepID=A4KVY1_CHLKI|nr:NADH dehydrogenase subunit 6 [Chlamydosaurus kingii]ABK53975.1 NADH dehydrogenase subunit 6 [Chlamydosaurus kingii]ABK53988.1 NADH dehydrogenase subunit 6 [Chlamydosaurus kingii]ABK54001.1 NADH dehydrogenase subunit 6 [Chlamydosaurus kingii]